MGSSLLRIQFAFAALMAASPAFAAEDDKAAPAAAASTSSIVAYPAAFFASAQPNTAMDMLGRLPGFTFDGGDGVRGFSGAAGNVLIDGERPTSKSDSLEEILRRMPAAQVERIELIRGGASGIDMQGKTVLANVVRKTEVAATTIVSVADTFIDDGRQNPAIRVEWSSRAGGSSTEAGLLLASYYDDGAGDGPRARHDGAGGLIGRWNVYTEGDGVQDILTAAHERPMFGGKVRVNGRLFYETFYYDEAAYGIGVDDGLVERDHQKRQEGELGLNYTRELGPRTDLEALFLQQLKSYDLLVKLQEPPEDLDAAFTVERTSGESIGRATMTFRNSAALSFETGAEGAWNWLESEAGFSNNGEVIDLPAASVRVEELRGEAFTKATWIPNPKLTIEGGLRMEGSRISSEGDVVLEKTLHFAKPRAVATYSPDAGNQFRVRVEREVGQLNFDDFVAATSAGVVTSGNPDLEPEQAWVAEAAYERRFMKSGSLTFTVRHYEITDVIDRAPDPSDEFDAPANIGDGTRDEAAVNLTLPMDWIGLTGGVLTGESTWRRSEVTDPTTGGTREISGERPVDWQAHYSQGVPRWNATIGFDAYGAWRETYYRFNEIQTNKLGTFVITYVEWKPVAGTSIRLAVQNATSRDQSRQREVYDGPRGADPLLFNEAQSLDNRPNVYLRVRKTL